MIGCPWTWHETCIEGYLRMFVKQGKTATVIALANHTAAWNL
jgi:hypothetical protein